MKTRAYPHRDRYGGGFLCIIPNYTSGIQGCSIRNGICTKVAGLIVVGGVSPFAKVVSWGRKQFDLTVP